MIFGMYSTRPRGCRLKRHLCRLKRHMCRLKRHVCRFKRHACRLKRHRCKMTQHAYTGIIFTRGSVSTRYFCAKTLFKGLGFTKNRQSCRFKAICVSLLATVLIFQINQKSFQKSAVRDSWNVFCAFPRLSV